MAMIRLIACEEVLDMAEQMRAAANVLERIAGEIEEGSEIRPGMTATDAMYAVRAFHPRISDLCATVYQLRASMLKPEATPPPPSQPYEDEEYDPSSTEYQIAGEELPEVARPEEFPLEDEATALPKN
jgi:hypothetical protein